MRRILKSNGSIYLHCDDTAAHWLRVLMELVFGRRAFRNEVFDTARYWYFMSPDVSADC